MSQGRVPTWLCAAWWPIRYPAALNTSLTTYFWPGRVCKCLLALHPEGLVLFQVSEFRLKPKWSLFLMIFLHSREDCVWYNYIFHLEQLSRSKSIHLFSPFVPPSLMSGMKQLHRFLTECFSQVFSPWQLKYNVLIIAKWKTIWTKLTTLTSAVFSPSALFGCALVQTCQKYQFLKGLMAYQPRPQWKFLISCSFWWSGRTSALLLLHEDFMQREPGLWWEAHGCDTYCSVKPTDTIGQVTAGWVLPYLGNHLPSPSGLLSCWN